MTTRATGSLARLILDAAHPLTGAEVDFEPILSLVGGARVVLIGEASHGTHKFYRTRAEITKRLIRDRGFAAVAAEADWPDAYRVNRYVRGTGGDVDATEALRGFERFPQWMWRNADVLDFIGWLRGSTTSNRMRRDASAFTDSTCTVCMHRWPRCWTTCASSIPRRPGARGTATRASTSSARTRKPTATRRPTA